MVLMDFMRMAETRISLSMWRPTLSLKKVSIAALPLPADNWDNFSSVDGTEKDSKIVKVHGVR